MTESSNQSHDKTAILDRYGVMGYPVSHSKSPIIHQLFAEQTEQKLIYELFKVAPDNLDTAVRSFQRQGGRGLNMTVPHKMRVVRLVDELSEAASIAGAVNTLVIDQDHIVGHNTDGIGLVRDLITPKSQILDLGCGRGGLIEQLTHPLPQIIGVDPDIVSLKEHRLSLQSAVTTEPLPFPENSFDIVLASWVFEHWRRPIDSLNEVARVLKPTGSLVFITPNKQHPLIRLNQLLSLAEAQSSLVERLYGRKEDDTFPAYYRASTQVDIDGLASIVGLKLESITEIPDPTYLAFNDIMFRAMVSSENLIPQNRKLHLVGILRKPH